MQCYCENLAKENPDQVKEKYLIKNMLSIDNKKQESRSDQKVAVCELYKKDKQMNLIISSSISFIIIAINMVLRSIVIVGIKWVGQHTYSEQLASITNGVFYAQFFNTGLIILFVNADLSEHVTYPFGLAKQLAGSFYDYSPQWYADVGFKICFTMIIQSFLPYVTLIVGFAVPYLKRVWDSKFSGDEYTTRQITMQLYKDVHSGADYVIHFKYSAVLNIVYVTCMYGAGMPILFPIAAFNFFNQWMVERILVAYVVRQPPALDAKLTQNCVAMLQFAPLLLLFNGYWMLSNR